MVQTKFHKSRHSDLQLDITIRPKIFFLKFTQMTCPPYSDWNGDQETLKTSNKNISQHTPARDRKIAFFISEDFSSGDHDKIIKTTPLRPM